MGPEGPLEGEFEVCLPTTTPVDLPLNPEPEHKRSDKQRLPGAETLTVTPPERLSHHSHTLVHVPYIVHDHGSCHAVQYTLVTPLVPSSLPPLLTGAQVVSGGPPRAEVTLVRLGVTSTTT